MNWERIKSALQGPAPRKLTDEEFENPIGGGSDVPIPGVKNLKDRTDDFLTENVVDKFANSGWPNLGAALATGPSLLMEYVVPENVNDLAMPLPPGISKGARYAKSAAKKAFPKASLDSKIKKELRVLDKELYDFPELAEELGYEETKDKLKKLSHSFLDDERVIANDIDKITASNEQLKKTGKMIPNNQENQYREAISILNKRKSTATQSILDILEKKKGGR